MCVCVCERERDWRGGGAATLPNTTLIPVLRTLCKQKNLKGEIQPKIDNFVLSNSISVNNRYQHEVVSNQDFK